VKASAYLLGRNQNIIVDKSPFISLILDHKNLNLLDTIKLFNRLVDTDIYLLKDEVLEVLNQERIDFKYDFLFNKLRASYESRTRSHHLDVSCLDYDLITSLHISGTAGNGYLATLESNIKFQLCGFNSSIESLTLVALFNFDFSSLRFLKNLKYLNLIQCSVYGFNNLPLTIEKIYLSSVFATEIDDLDYLPRLNFLEINNCELLGSFPAVKDGVEVSSSDQFLFLD